METNLTVTVSDLYEQNKFKFLRGRYNILDCGVRTGKTYWAINNLKDFTRDGKLCRILFLTDTLSLKDSIISSYSDTCCDANQFWINANGELSELESNKIGIMCYQTLGMQVIKNQTDYLENIDVICWDECDSIFDFAATAFARARKVDFARKESSNQEILSLIQQHSTQQVYMPLILLGFWEQIIVGNRILCIGLSATPERARLYYESITSNSYKGKIETSYRATEDIYFKNIIDHIKQLTPLPGMGYWCYSRSIEYNRAIVQAANNQGFHAIEIHSMQNANQPMTDEQKRVVNCIETLHIVPYEYDFVVVTRAYERGINIVDPRFRHLIVDSFLQTDRIQAARQTFPYQRHIKVLCDKVPDEYMNRWLTLAECRDLAEVMAVPDIDIRAAATKVSRQARIMTWNKLQELLVNLGYSIEKKRKRLPGNPNAVNCYMITGEWHDVEIAVENDFMQLVAAKSGNEILEIE